MHAITHILTLRSVPIRILSSPFRRKLETLKKSKLLLGACVLGISTMAVSCPNTGVVPNYPYSNTLHIDGNGDMYYTVYRDNPQPGWWYFKVDVYITDGWNDDDCIYADFFGDLDLGLDTRETTKICATSGDTSCEQASDLGLDHPRAELATQSEMRLCRNKEWYGDPVRLALHHVHEPVSIGAVMRAKYLLGLSLVMLTTMANDCTPTVHS